MVSEKKRYDMGYLFKTPEEYLAFEIINDAKDIIAKKRKTKPVKGHYVDWKEELEWLLNDDCGDMNHLSFVDCCDMLGRNACLYRKKILEEIKQMPIHEYLCSNCGKVTTRVYKTQKGVQDKITCKCKEKATKMISAGSFKVNGYNEKNGYGE